MSNRSKPLSLITGKHITKVEKERRQKSEEKLKAPVQDILKVPTFLDADTKKFYRRTLKLIGPEGTNILCDTDKDTLTTYAAAVSILKRCTKEINENGLIVNGKPNPALKLYENYSKLVKSFSSAFGLDPFSRSKLSLANQDTETEAEKEFKNSDAYRLFGDRL